LLKKNITIKISIFFYKKISISLTSLVTTVSSSSQATLDFLAAFFVEPRFRFFDGSIGVAGGVGGTTSIPAGAAALTHRVRSNRNLEGCWQSFSNHHFY
jgi:hypothetical protein